MPFEISIDKTSGIVEVVVRGTDPQEEHRSARVRAAQMLAENGLTRLMVDLRELVSDPASSSVLGYEFGSTYDADGIHSQIRVAHIMPHDPAAREQVEFTTTVGNNRGLYIKGFDGVEEARAWLIGTDDSGQMLTSSQTEESD